jgi:hypothetical protein
MRTIKFLGRGIPKHLRVGFSAPLGFTLARPNEETIRFEVAVHDSVVSVECEVKTGSRDEISFLYARASNYAQCALNTLAFGYGAPLVSMLDEFEGLNGERVGVDTSRPELAALCTAYEPSKASFNEAFNLLVGDPVLFMAFDDLLNAMRDSLLATVNCGRMLDALRRMVAAPGASEGEQWRILREILNVDRSYIQPISDGSLGPRHGMRVGQPASVVNDIIKRSWIIMNRFLIYRLSADVPLQADEHPLLT